MKKYIFLFLIAPLLSFKGFGQLIRPLDKGLQQFNQNIQTIYSYGNDLYVVTNGGSTNVGANFEYKIKIAKWNGISWSYLPTLRAISSLDIPAANYFIKNLCAYNNDLYITGMFDSISGLTGSCGIVKWNGKQYMPVGGGLQFNDGMKQNPINASQGQWGISVYLNRLVVAGEIKKAGNTNVNNLASWNGTTWSYVGNSSSAQGFLNTTTGYTFRDYFRGLAVEKNHLIMLGDFTKVGGITGSIEKVVLWNDSLWGNMSPGWGTDPNFLDQITFIMPYYIDNYREVLFYSSATKAMGMTTNWGWAITQYGTIASFTPKTYGTGPVQKPLLFNHSGKLWAIGTDNFFYNYSTTQGVWTKSSLCQTPNTIPSSRANLESDVAYFGGMQTYGTDTLNYIGRFSDDKGVVTGKVYLDQNNNCQFDSGEPLIKNAIINYNGSSFVSSNEAGVYTTEVFAGTYTFGLTKTGKNWTQSCPGGSGTYQVTAIADSVKGGYDFGIVRDSVTTDVQVSLTGNSGWRARRGFAESYVLNISNIGNTPTGAFSVFLQLPAKGNKEYISTTPDNITGTTYRFDISNLPVNEQRKIKFNFRIPGPDSININENLSFIAYCSAAFTATDDDQLDNVDTLNQKVTAAHDPNDKQSNPHIYVLPWVKKIDYQIRFQNIGDDTAYGVTVLDTVDTRLPLKEISINAASHLYRFAVINNVLIWRFDNIMLAPVKIDEPKSHGWIRYSSKLAQGLPLGTEILNKAYIYFDYEKPVITNDALIRLVPDSVSIGNPEKPKAITETLKLYPNPASNFLVLENTSSEADVLEVYSIVGEKILVHALSGNTQLIINTLDWKSGVYLVRSAETGKSVTVVIQH